MSDGEYVDIKKRLDSMASQIGLMDRALRGDGDARIGLASRVRSLELKVSFIQWAGGGIAGAFITQLIRTLMS